MMILVLGAGLFSGASPDLILPAGVWRVHHAVTPVLLFDLVLLLRQEVQLLLTAVHVFVQIAQVMPAPLGVVLNATSTQTGYRVFFLLFI